MKLTSIAIDRENTTIVKFYPTEEMLLIYSAKLNLFLYAHVNALQQLTNDRTIICKSHSVRINSPVAKAIKSLTMSPAAKEREIDRRVIRLSRCSPHD